MATLTWAAPVREEAIPWAPNCETLPPASKSSKRCDDECLVQHLSSVLCACHGQLGPALPTPFVRTSSHRRGGWLPTTLDAPDRNGPLVVQPLGVSLVGLLLAVLQALALVVLEEPVLAAEMAGAEAAVAHYALRRVLACLETTPDLLGRHATAQREGHVQHRVRRERERGQGGARRGQMAAGMHETQVGGGQAVSQGEEGGEGGYRGRGRECQRDCWDKVSGL